MASLLHACFKVRVVDWQGVSLCVEHPVVQRQHVIFTEQKIQVPGARKEMEGNTSGTPGTHKHWPQLPQFMVTHSPLPASLSCLKLPALVQRWHNRKGICDQQQHQLMLPAKGSSAPRGSKFRPQSRLLCIQGINLAEETGCLLAKCKGAQQSEPPT